VGGAILTDGARINPHHAVAETAHLVHLVTDKDDGAAFAGDIAHFAETFFLEIDVADGEHFIDEEDFGLEMGGDGEGQADVHAGGVVLDGSVDEFFELGEGYDFVEFAGDFATAHAEDSPTQKRVFAAGKLGMEAGADFEEGADAAVNFGPAGGRASDTREDLEKSGFAGAVAADETEDFAFADFEGDVLEGPESFVFFAAKGSERGTEKVLESVAQTGFDAQAATVALGERFGVDDDRAHCSDSVGNGGLHAIEEKEAAEEDEGNDGGGGEEH